MEQILPGVWSRTTIKFSVSNKETAKLTIPFSSSCTAKSNQLLNMSRYPERVGNTPVPIPQSLLREILIEEDLKIKANGGEVKLHKALLKHYCRELTGNVEEDAKVFGYLEAIPYQVVESFRGLLYGSAPAQVLEDCHMIFAVIQVANALKADAVTELCIMHFDTLEVHQVTIKEILDSFASAHMMQIERMKQKAVKLLKQVPEDELKDSMDMQDLLRLNTTVAAELISILCT